MRFGEFGRRTKSRRSRVAERWRRRRNGMGSAGEVDGGDMADNQLEQLTSGVPKVIDARTHAIIDYATAGTFLAAGAMLRRKNPAASTFSYMNGLAVIATSMMTNYPGGLWKVFSFKTHGTIDACLATMVAVGPALLGFASEPEGQFFHGHAALEAGVIAATDFASA
jgi:hypothetical protein